MRAEVEGKLQARFGSSEWIKQMYHEIIIALSKGEELDDYQSTFLAIEREKERER